MRLKPQDLPRHLQRDLLPIYLVSGDETLLVQESCDAIRQAARTAGCSDREILDADPKDFDWQLLLASAANLSLFGERKLIELRLPSGKPGAEGSKALCEYAQHCGPDNVLLIIAGKVDKQSTNAKWFKTLDQAGAVIQVWPVDARQLPRWLGGRIQAAGLSIDDDALHLLCERVEGNLLAAVQEVEKLKLLATDNRVDIATVADAVGNSARYDLFGMVDRAMQGDTAGSLRMLQGLRAEGTEPPVVLWALTRELQTLLQARELLDAGQPQGQVFKSLRIWQSKAACLEAALRRHNARATGTLINLATAADGAIKGYAKGKPWDQLATVVHQLAGGVPADTPRYP